MNILLIFFAIPLATIILSMIIESLINYPLKVSGIFFSIFIVIAFVLGGDAEFILAALIYTMISFITAEIVRIVINKMCNICGKSCDTSRFYNNYDSVTSYNDINSLEKLNRIGLNSNVNAQNILTENAALNSNNINNVCRKYR